METVNELWLIFIKEYPLALQLSAGPRDLKKAVEIVMHDAFLTGVWAATVVATEKDNAEKEEE